MSVLGQSLTGSMVGLCWILGGRYGQWAGRSVVRRMSFGNVRLYMYVCLEFAFSSLMLQRINGSMKERNGSLDQWIKEGTIRQSDNHFYMCFFVLLPE